MQSFVCSLGVYCNMQYTRLKSLKRNFFNFIGDYFLNSQNHPNGLNSGQCKKKMYMYATIFKLC